jgi:hypothetical protein
MGRWDTGWLQRPQPRTRYCPWLPDAYATQLHHALTSIAAGTVQVDDSDLSGFDRLVAAELPVCKDGASVIAVFDAFCTEALQIQRDLLPSALRLLAEVAYVATSLRMESHWDGKDLTAAQVEAAFAYLRRDDVGIALPALPLGQKGRVTLRAVTAWLRANTPRDPEAPVPPKRYEPTRSKPPLRWQVEAGKVLDRLGKERAAAIAANRPVPLIPRGRPGANVHRPVSLNDGNDAWSVHDSDDDDDVVLKSPLLRACSAGDAQKPVSDDSASVRGADRGKDDDPSSSSTTTKDSDDMAKA